MFCCKWLLGGFMDKRVILHIDMNNFYASVECLLNPSIKNYAVAVAGDPNKRTGIILAKNYLAKVYGVKTGEAIWEAKQKCPTLITVAPHFDKYNEYSQKAHKIYYQYTDIIEPFGIDECWLDVTDSLKLFNLTPIEIAKKIQNQIFDELGLTVSIGISWGKTLAKLGSDMKKPKGLTVIDESNHIEVIDLYLLEPEFLRQHFGVVGVYLHNAVSGIDDDKLIVPKDEDTKSVGNGATAVKDMREMFEIKDFLHDLSVRVSKRLRAHKFQAKTIHVTIKFADFTYLSAQNTYPTYFSNEQDIYNYSLDIFTHLAGEKFPPVRAIRICTTNLITGDSLIQSNIFLNNKNESVCSTIDKLKEKYGENIITLGKDFFAF